MNNISINKRLIPRGSYPSQHKKYYFKGAVWDRILYYVIDEQLCFKVKLYEQHISKR